jgi:hypothetical protein
MLEEGVSDHRHERMTVKALPGRLGLPLLPALPGVRASHTFPSNSLAASLFSECDGLHKGSFLQRVGARNGFWRPAVLAVGSNAIRMLCDGQRARWVHVASGNLGNRELCRRLRYADNRIAESNHIPDGTTR